jgi:hypothetical protein
MTFGPYYRSVPPISVGSYGKHFAAIRCESRGLCFFGRHCATFGRGMRRASYSWRCPTRSTYHNRLAYLRSNP